MPKGQGKRGPRGPKRPANVVFQSKLETTFKTATNLIGKLQTMQRASVLRNDAELRARYSKFVEAIATRVQACAPSVALETPSETLASWTA